MKILHLVGDLKLPRDPDTEGASGVINATLEVARVQVARGHEVWVAAVGRDSWKAQWHGVNLVLLKPARWGKIRLGSRTMDFQIHLPYVALTNTHQFDIVQGCPYYYLRFLKARARVTYFQTDPLHQGNGTHTAALSAADFALVAQNSGAQVAASRFVADQLRRGLGERGNIHVVYNGVDAQRFAPERWQPHSARMRAQWGIPEDAVVLLYAGAIVPEKGVVHLARAFARLCDQTSNVHLVLAGSSALWIQNLMTDDPALSYEHAVRAELEQLTQQGRVHFLGKVGAGDMPAVYGASDVVVIPSVWGDPFPLVALEALASGCPVVASNTGGLPESVNATNGLLVPPGDEHALQDALHLLVQDSGLRHQLGQMARVQGRRFSWETAARTLDMIYAAQLQEGRQYQCVDL